jgi:predicted nucleic acid-binding protein
MTGLDSNILVQLAVAEHPRNGATTELFQAEIQRGETFALPLLVATEFLHVVTDERRFDPPMTQTLALDWIEGFLTLPEVNTVESNEASLHLTLQWMRKFQLGRKRILDTHLAAILHTHGLHRLLTSNPGDFAVFGVLETVVP